jgi:hypothetical protein
VRDWQEWNEVNDAIRNTLDSAERSRFVLMNNGVTIITRDLRKGAASRFHIEDYQIVNGCQTSHVIYHMRHANLNNVHVPLRLIVTQDEDVMESIIRATNSQTPVKPEEFAAILDFSKELEAHFATYPPETRLYYERRPGQYRRKPVEATRVISLATMVRAFSAMFLEQPHTATRRTRKRIVGSGIFGADHKLEPYYAAASAFYRLDVMLRTGRLPAKFRPARYHILMAVRILINSDPMPGLNSRRIEARSAEIAATLWDQKTGDDIFRRAADSVDDVARGNFERDSIRVQSFTEGLKKKILGLP